MNGIDRNTGKSIAGIAYLRQRLNTLLTTPAMTRVARRAYSGVFNFVDKPVNKTFLVDLYAQIATAVNKWEPELKIKKISLNAVSQGRIELQISGQYQEIGTDASNKTVDIELSTSLSNQR